MMATKFQTTERHRIGEKARLEVDMVDVMLWTWLWVIAGCFAVYTHGDDIKRDTSFLEIAILVVAWPWWLSHYKNGVRRSREDNDPRVVPVRIETHHKKPRKR